MGHDLGSVLNEKTVRRLADHASYERGTAYFCDGAVQSLTDVRNGIEAVVLGSYLYDVKLLVGAGTKLKYSCSCPVGMDGDFCKHCVAVGLTWLASQVIDIQTHRKIPKTSVAKRKPLTIDQAEKVLRSLDAGTLANVILDWAKTDAGLRQRVLQFASDQSSTGAASVAAARRAFQTAIEFVERDEYNDYNQYNEYDEGWDVADVEDALDQFEDLLNAGYAAQLSELCEWAIPQLEEACESLGEFDAESEDGLSDRLAALHHTACVLAPPDSEVLARRLFELELNSDFSMLRSPTHSYTEMLGPKGMVAYRKIAEAAWKKSPADRDIQSILERLARYLGDFEGLVAIKARNLNTSGDYLELVEILLQEGEIAKAIEWAEKGLVAFPTAVSGLPQLTAELYRRNDRAADAIPIVWRLYCAQAALSTYQELERYSTAAEVWPEYRIQALTELRRLIADGMEKAKAKRSYGYQPFADHSTLVEIFLYEKDLQTAWLEAKEGGCRSGLWVSLAELMSKGRPADAGLIYLDQAEVSVANTSNSRYDESVQLLIRAAAVMTAAGLTQQFLDRIQALRKKYKIKRNFIALMDKNRKRLLY